MQYHREELAFIHFGMNTYYDREWGDGQEDPYYFYPEHLDTDQWIKTLKDTGFKTDDHGRHTTIFPLVPFQIHRPYHCQKWLEGWKKVILAEVSASAASRTWTWGSTSRLGMLTAHSTMWIQRTNTTNTISTSLGNHPEDPKYE